MNSPAPFIPHNVDKNEYPRSTPTNGTDASKFYQKNENFYTNQPQEKFDPMYRYDDKNFYSNIGNIPAPQVPVTSDRLNRSTRNAVYSNIEPAIPIPVPQPIQKEKDIVYSNIQWNTTKPENTYCNIPAQGHSTGELPNFLMYVKHQHYHHPIHPFQTFYYNSSYIIFFIFAFH